MQAEERMNQRMTAWSRMTAKAAKAPHQTAAGLDAPPVRHRGPI